MKHIWIKAVRRLDAVEIFYSFDDKGLKRMAERQCEIKVVPKRVVYVLNRTDRTMEKCTESDT